MTPITTSRLILVTVVIGAGALLSVMIWHQSLGHGVADWTGRLLAPLAVPANHAVIFFHQYVGRGDLVNENLHLTDELTQARAAVADRDELRRENDFLRAVSGIHDRIGREVVVGAVFSYLSDGASRQVVVNRGSRDHVVSGDIVVTAQSELVGVVQEVFNDHAIVRPLGDPNFDVTARVMGTDVSGLVRSDIQDGLVMDLVQKAETVTEGQTVVTSGNDQFLSGLIIGTVRSVDNDSTSLFKIVRLAAAVMNTFSGSVVIIHL